MEDRSTRGFSAIKALGPKPEPIAPNWHEPTRKDPNWSPLTDRPPGPPTPPVRPPRPDKPRPNPDKDEC
jgi:hypothetical protein